MNQYTGAPDQGGQMNREIKLGIEVLAIAHRLLDLIPFNGPTGNGLRKRRLRLGIAVPAMAHTVLALIRFILSCFMNMLLI